MSKDKTPYGQILIDKKAIEQSLKDIGFKCYTYKGKPIDMNDHANDSLTYLIDSQKMFFPAWDHRKHVRPKTRREIVFTYFSNIKFALEILWDAIRGRGHECE